MGFTAKRRAVRPSQAVALMKYFFQWWGGTILYIFTVALLPDAQKYLDFVGKIAQSIKRYWVDYCINYVSIIVHFVERIVAHFVR